MNKNVVKSEIKEYLDKFCFFGKSIEELEQTKVEDLWAHKIHVLSYMVGKYHGCEFDEIYYVIYELIQDEIERRKKYWNWD